MREMREYTTERGRTLYWTIGYDLGGFNYFTGKSDKRGYSLIIQRQHNCFTLFTGLEDKQGAIRVFIKEVKRQSAKARAEVEQLAEQKIAEVVADYNARGVEL